MARFPTSAKAGWEAALLEIEHQAEQWNKPEHRETGHLIAQALLAAVDMARAGRVRSEHRQQAVRVRRPDERSSGSELPFPVGWRCTYEGRAGGRAHATFASIDQAKVFAELHAQASGTSGAWVEADGSWELRTLLGDYLVRGTKND